MFINVAPHVGAWIETSYEYSCYAIRLSLPMWERGLKQTDKIIDGKHKQVAPHVGAWIETL